MEMSTSVLCTNNTAWIGDPGYLYLPSGWYVNPLFRPSLTILDVLPESHRAQLYVLSHGPIWIVPKKKQYWRLDVLSVFLHPNLVKLNQSTRLWEVVGGKLIRAEGVSYEELKLEAVFG